MCNSSLLVKVDWVMTGMATCYIVATIMLLRIYDLVIVHRVAKYKNMYTV